MALLPLVLLAPLFQEPITTQEPVVAPVAVPPATDVAPTIAEPVRIAATPLIDGTLEADEWDPLTGGNDGSAAYFQWEPDALHLGARVPTGRDAVFSVDADADGWLVGSRNVEVRVGLRDGRPVAFLRRLDAANLNGPTWSDLPVTPELVQAVAREDGGTTVVEITVRRIGDAFGALAEGQRVGLRFDALTPEDQRAPFLPRAVSPVSLALSRASGLPEGASFNLRKPVRSVVPGERVEVQWVFTGLPKPAPTRVGVKSIGGGRSIAATTDEPFPVPDLKGRAGVPYASVVAPDARIGYAILRATVTGADGVPSVVDASFRVSEPVDVEIISRKTPVSDRDLSLPVSVYVRSNADATVRGSVTIKAPAPLRVLNDPARKFATQTRRGRSRLSYDVYVPPRTVGTFPIVFEIEANGRKYSRIQYLTLGG